MVQNHLVLCATLLFTCACTTLPGREETHTITAHWASPLCSKAPGTTPHYALEALGDFPPSNDTSESLDQKQALVVPDDTRGAILDANDGFTRFLGVGTAGSAPDIDVSLWPAGAPCTIPVPATDGCDYPGGGVGYALGVSADSRTLLLAGGDLSREGDDARTREVSASALAVDLATGTATCLPARSGLQLGRAGATITPLGDELLVAGGFDPIDESALGTGEVFDPATRQFEPEFVGLRGARARHGAVALASGDVLLVGGVDGRGDPIEPGAHTPTLEAIEPKTRRSRSDLAELDRARVDPVVLRLSDHRIFIAGGNDGTAAATPLQSLLWLDASAASIVNTLDSLDCGSDQRGDAAFVATERSFAAMPGGAVLAVADGCTLVKDAAAACATTCENGLGCPSSEVFWIDRDGNVTCCGDGRPSCSGPPIVELAEPLVDAALLPGAAGRPWLLEGARGARTLRTFDPFTGQFPLAGTALDLDPSTVVAADAGLLSWVSDCRAADAPVDCVATLQGFRHGVRGPYAQAVAPLLLGDTEGIAPDRAPSPPPDPGAVAPRPSRDQAGNVEITPGAALVLTDTTYADLHLTVHVTAGTTPLIRLNATTFGGDDRRWPVLSPEPPYDADLARTGDSVTLTIGSRSLTYGGPMGRVSVAVAAGPGALKTNSITIIR